MIPCMAQVYNNAIFGTILALRRSCPVIQETLQRACHTSINSIVERVVYRERVIHKKALNNRGTYMFLRHAGRPGGSSG